VDGCTIISSDAYGANYDTSEATLSYCQKTLYTPGFGDGILISDRNSGYTLNSVTVKNTKFIHEGDNVIGAFGLRVVDCAADGDDTQAIITLENLSFSDNLSGRTVTVCGEYSEENWITSEYECKWIISAE
ncbi:MAG: hypothetical protein IJX58_02475, partial [Clostridia bacterium]|nr:hypothetical protein [Clostridia bacterium]